VGSYVFYGAWNPLFLPLIWISTLTDWFVGARIAALEDRAAKWRVLLVSLTVNLGLLGFFKYGGFILKNAGSALAPFGFPSDYPFPDIILPVGISFYTFQTLSYSLDIYRGTGRPWRSLLDYSLYVAFFPQLVAGPIVRAFYFLPQLLNPTKVRLNDVAWGGFLFLLGLFEKVALADGIFAPAADGVFDGPGVPGTVQAWCGTLAFTGQIFCDFAGYSTCAIGIARCFGFRLPVNFRMPYAAAGFSDFWKRWHVSLSTWLRDYLYISLGGNRKGPWRTLGNILITMLLGGLWHGASWTFVAWGGLHGLFLILERAVKKVVPPDSFWRGPWMTVPLGLATFVAVAAAWVFFRARSFDRAFEILGSLLGLGGPATLAALPPVSAGLVWAAVLIILMTHGVMRNRDLETAAAKTPWWGRSLVIAGMILAMILFSGEDRAFIYFQF